MGKFYGDKPTRRIASVMTQKNGYLVTTLATSRLLEFEREANP